MAGEIENLFFEANQSGFGPDENGAISKDKLIDFIIYRDQKKIWDYIDTIPQNAAGNIELSAFKNGQTILPDGNIIDAASLFAGKKSVAPRELFNKQMDAYREHLNNFFTEADGISVGGHSIKNDGKITPEEFRAASNQKQQPSTQTRGEISSPPPQQEPPATAEQKPEAQQQSQPEAANTGNRPGTVGEAIKNKNPLFFGGLAMVIGLIFVFGLNIIPWALGLGAVGMAVAEIWKHYDKDNPSPQQSAGAGQTIQPKAGEGISRQTEYTPHPLEEGKVGSVTVNDPQGKLNLSGKVEGGFLYVSNIAATTPDGSFGEVANVDSSHSKQYKIPVRDGNIIAEQSGNQLEYFRNLGNVVNNRKEADKIKEIAENPLVRLNQKPTLDKYGNEIFDFNLTMVGNGNNIHNYQIIAGRNEKSQTPDDLVLLNVYEYSPDGKSKTKVEKVNGLSVKDPDIPDAGTTEKGGDLAEGLASILKPTTVPQHVRDEAREAVRNGGRANLTDGHPKVTVYPLQSPYCVPNSSSVCR